jgi:hypothetical protein
MANNMDVDMQCGSVKTFALANENIVSFIYKFFLKWETTSQSEYDKMCQLDFDAIVETAKLLRDPLYIRLIFHQLNQELVQHYVQAAKMIQSFGYSYSDKAGSVFAAFLQRSFPAVYTHSYYYFGFMEEEASLYARCCYGKLWIIVIKSSVDNLEQQDDLTGELGLEYDMVDEPQWVKRHHLSTYRLPTNRSYGYQEVCLNADTDTSMGTLIPRGYPFRVIPDDKGAVLLLHSRQYDMNQSNQNQPVGEIATLDELDNPEDDFVPEKLSQVLEFYSAL